MSSTVANRSPVLAIIGFSFFWAAGALASQPESEAKVVARLYKDYAWQAIAAQPDLFGEGLVAESKICLEKYFAPDLARLLVSDSACQVKTGGICNLDFDPLFDSQDPRVTDLNVERLSPGKVRVQFKDPVTEKTTRIEFKLATVGGKWRITDIIYSTHAEPSLNRLLSRHLPP